MSAAGPGSAEQWAARERLCFLERLAWWRGELRRKDVMAVFGAGTALVSADFQRYQDLNPGALTYNLRRKCYEGMPEMSRRLDASTLEDAVSLFLPGAGTPPVTGRMSASGNGKAEWLVLPERRAAAQVERRVFQAVLHGRKLRIHYRSVNSGTREWRWVRPSVLAHSGHSWYARSWCLRDGAWKHFSLGRMAAAEWPVEADAPSPPDREWETWEVVTLRPNPQLSAEARAAVALEYGMKDDRITVRVRRAMRVYLDSALHLLRDGEAGWKPRVVEAEE